MEVVDVDADCSHTLTTEEIDNLVKECFTEEEYAQLPYNKRLSYRVLCTVYMTDSRHAEKCTLKEFLTNKPSDLERKYPHITGSPKVYPKPEPYDTNFWHTYSTCDSSSDESNVPHKPTLEEMWDLSDAEHELEHAAKRVFEAMINPVRDQGGPKKRGPKGPPKKRGRKKKIVAKPKSKPPPGKPRGRKRKIATDPKPPVLRDKNAPVTRSQVAAQKAAEKTADEKVADAEAAEKVEPEGMSQNGETSLGVAQEAETPQSAAQKLQKADASQKSETKNGTRKAEKKVATKRTEAKRAAERAGAKRAAEKAAAKRASERAEAKRAIEKAEAKRATEKAEAKPDIEIDETSSASPKPEASDLTEGEEIKSNTQISEVSDVTDNSETKDAPPAKKRRAPRRRFVPPPPPPCFYSKPPYRRKKIFIDLSIPPIPDPLFRNANSSNNSFRPCQCGPSSTGSRYSPGMVDLTEPSVSCMFEHQMLERSPQWDLSQPSSYIPRLPPPLAPLSYKPSTTIQLSTGDKPSASSQLDASTVPTPPPIPYNLMQSDRYLEEKIDNKTPTPYVPQSKHKRPENVEPDVIGPGFYVPRTLEALSDQSQTDSNVNKKNEEPSTSIAANPLISAAQPQSLKVNATEQTPTSTALYVQKIQAKYRDISQPSTSVRSYKHSVPYSSSYVPTVQANTTTPYSLTYVKSPQDPVKSQPSTSCTFAMPETPLSVSFAGNDTKSVPNERKVKILGNTSPTISYLPIMTTEREKRIQPKRIINKKKFIVRPKSHTIVISSKETDKPVFRPLQDITKSGENRQNIEKNKKENKGGILPVVSSLEKKPETTRTGFIPTDRAGREKRPAEMTLPETESSDTDTSAETKPSIKRTMVKRPLLSEKPQIKVPPHVKPCPTHCPASMLQTKQLLTTAVREKYIPIIKQKLEPTTTASSEVFVSLSETQVLAFQQAQVEALSSLTRPLAFGNTGAVPVEATLIQKQLKTDEGPEIKQTKFGSAGSPKMIAHKEITPVSQALAVQTPESQLLISRPTVIQTSQNLLTQTKVAVVQTKLPQTNLYPGPKPSLIIKSRDNIFECDPKLPSSSSDDEEEIITLQFPTDVDQSQIPAFTAQQIKFEPVRQTLRSAPQKPISNLVYTKFKQAPKPEDEMSQRKLTKISSIPVMKTHPVRQGQITAASRPIKAVEATQTQIKTSLPKPVHTDSKSCVNTQTPIKALPSKTEYTSRIADKRKLPITNVIPEKNAQSSTASKIPTQTKVIPRKFMHPSMPQIKTDNALVKAASNEFTPTSQPPTKVIPAQTVQTMGTVTSTIQAQIKTASAETVQTLRTLASATQAQIKTTTVRSVEALRASSSIAQIKTTTIKSVQTLGTSVTTTQTQIKSVSAKTVQTLGMQVLTAQTQLKTIPTKTVVTPTSTVQLKQIPLIQLVKKPDGEIKAIQGSSNSLEGPVYLTQLKKVASASAIENQSETKKVTSETDSGKKAIQSGSVHTDTVARREGQVPALATLIPVKKLVQASSASVQTPKTATTMPGSLAQMKPPLAATKVAHVQRLLSKMQSSFASSQTVKQKSSTVEKLTTTEAKSAMIPYQVEKDVVLAQTLTVVGSTPGTATVTITRPLKNIKILTPIRTSTGQFQTSVPDRRSLSTQSGTTRISLVHPGIYQVVHSTPTSTSEPKLYTADEMLAAEVLSSDLQSSIRRVIYKKVTGAAASLTTIRTATTSPTIPTSTLTTSCEFEPETPEMEESPKTDKDKMETLASLQSTANRSGSRLTRTASGEASRPLRTSEIYSSFDTLYPLSSKTKFTQKQSFSFESYWKKPSSTQKSFFDEESASNRALETCYTPRYNTRKKSDHDDKWSYKEFRFPSPPMAQKMSESAFSASSDFQFNRYKPTSIKDRTDYLSLSLSPPGSRSESVFLRDCPSLSPSKDVSLLDLEDIKKLRCIENRESQEDEAEYEAGGYMPINIGDVLRNQYKVCRKLGWGHFSTVWLCKNLYENGPRYVALKICKSAPMFTAVANDEIRLLQETRSVNPNHPGFNNIVQMVDTFKLISENGVHTAISLEIMGPSLLHLLMQSDFRGIQVPAVRRIIFQVLRGLTYLHEGCHIIHTDVKPENILIRVDENYIRRIIGKMERFSELGVELPRSYVSSEFWTEKDSNLHESDDDIISRFGEQRASSYPNDIYLSELVNYRERHSQTNFNSPMWVNPNIEIKIADLGNACWVDHHFSQEIQTRQYRALEVIMGAGYSYPADIWSVGCMAFELATGEMLFSPKGSSDLSANIDHLCLIWETLGGIPRYITETGSESKKFFVNGHLKDVPADNLRIWKIEDVLVEKYKWKRLDAIPFAGFLESLVEPDPALRATASQALTNEWLLSTDI